ncbi:MAG: hypothetical protein ACTSR6_13405 [Candidatus Heimdallarchaeota archaeon]
MKNIIKQLAQTNVTIDISSHILEDVESIAATFPPSDPSQVTIVFKPDIILDDGLILLMEFFSSNKIVIRNFNYLKPSLEQVYLKYVMEESTK